MSKILFVGDVHLSPRTPISRKDDYSETILNKIYSISSLVVENSIEHVVFLGDLFNTRHMTLPYFIKCFKAFQHLHDSGAELHLIVGNHDIYYNNETTMKDSPIDILLDSKLFSNDTFQVDDCLINLFNYTQTTNILPEASDSSLYNILVGHYFYNLGFGDELHTLSKEQCKALKYDSYILGHDHTPYAYIDSSTYSVHRPGSLSRGTSQTCQVNRNEINVLMLDTNSHEYTYLSLPNVLPSKEIYKESSLISKINMYSIDESLQELLNSLDFDNSSDIMETLNSIPMDDKVKETVLYYLSTEGIYNTTGGVT